MKLIIAILTLLTFAISQQVWSAEYTQTIKEGQSAAEQLIKQHQASALTITLVDANHIIWSQQFGVADPKSGKLPTETTMFGIGSVSKLLAAIAVMKLVDQGVIDVDKPLIDYLPSFKMDTPEYKNITIRMLLNHSAGFPGTDYRNLLIRTRVPDYVNQVLHTLSTSRLKAPPGYMSVYCNDCYTVLEAVIQNKTGKSYSQFMQDEIFTPLNMKNTRYPTQAFPDGSYVKALQKNQVLPMEIINSFASGGVYTTSDDLARVAMMFLNNGKSGSSRILSKESINKMAVDQTASKFNPVHSNSWAYGLGWDSVLQPGLLAVGFDGWIKNGDSSDYNAVFIVSPKAGLGIIVIGATGFSSAKATALGERILLRALAENGKIPKFPSPLTAIPSSEKLSGAIESPLAISGEYALFSAIYNLGILPEKSWKISTLNDKKWKPYLEQLKPLNGSWYQDRDTRKPINEWTVVNASLFGQPTPYLIVRAPWGYGHYLDDIIMAQKVFPSARKLSAAWRARVPLTWLVVNAHPDELTWDLTMDPRLRLITIPNLQGLIAISITRVPSQYQILNPAASDMRATMMLTIPQAQGRDLNDLIVVKREGKEWMRIGSYMYQPLSSVIKLVYGTTQTITIGPEGYAEWRSLAYQNKPIQITINTTSSWKLYNEKFESIAGETGKTATLPAGKGMGYLILFGKAGEIVSVSTN